MFFNLNLGPGPILDIWSAAGFRIVLAAVRLEVFEALQVLTGVRHASVIPDATDGQASAAAIRRVVESAYTGQPLVAQDELS